MSIADPAFIETGEETVFVLWSLASLMLVDIDSEGFSDCSLQPTMNSVHASTVIIIFVR